MLTSHIGLPSNSMRRFPLTIELSETPQKAKSVQTIHERTSRSFYSRASRLLSNVIMRNRVSFQKKMLTCTSPVNRSVLRRWASTVLVTFHVANTKSAACVL